MSTPPSNLDLHEIRSTYNHRLAWYGGVALHGVAIVAIGLCGAIAVILRDGDVATELATREPLSGGQIVGIGILMISALGLIVSHAASQNRDYLPPWLEDSIDWVGRQLLRLPKAGEMAEHLDDTDASSRFVAIVGPVVFAVATGIGTALATGLGGLTTSTGLRMFLLGGAFAGFAAALSGLLLERENTRIQTAAMFVCLVAATFATFDWWIHWLVAIVAGSLWIMLLSDVKEAIDRGVSWATFTMLGVAVAASTTLAELDNTLESLATSGSQPRGFSDLAPLSEPWAATDRVEEVARTWREFREGAALADTASEASTRVITAPADHLIRSLYVVIDSAGFAIAYTFLLLVATRFVMSRLDDSDRSRQLGSVLTVTRFAVPIILVLDIAENVSGAAAVLPYMHTDRDAGSVLAIIDGIAWIHWGAAVTKWLSLAGAAFAVVAGTLFAARQSRSTEDGTNESTTTDGTSTADTSTDGTTADVDASAIAETPTLSTSIRLLRVSIVLVAVIMLGLRNRQAYDAIRRFARGDGLAWEVIVLVAIVIGTGVAIRYLAELLCHQAAAFAVGSPREQESADGVDTADDRSRAGRNPRARLRNGATATAAALVLATLLDAWGVLIPIGIWLVLELLSLPLSSTGDARRERIGARDLLVAAGFVGGFLLVAYVVQVAAGNSGVRWVLVVFGAYEFWRALCDITTSDQVQSSLLGLRPLARSWGGLKPLWKRGAPWLLRSLAAIVDWVHYSTSRRLIMPVMWVWAHLTNAPEGQVRRVTVPQRSGPAEFTPGQRVAKLLGGLVPVFVGAAIIRAALGLALYDSENTGGLLLMLLGVALVLAGPVLYAVRPVNPPTWTEQQGIAAVRLAATTIFMIYIAAWELVDVSHAVTATRAVGAIGVLCLAIILFAVIGTSISYLTERSTPPRSLALVGFRKTPYFLLALLWIVVASTIDRGGYHNITVAEAATGTSGTRVTAQRLTDRWIDSCATTPDAQDPAGTTAPDEQETTDAEPVERPAVPMIFVAASGGGVRAAYWTASVLERLDQRVAVAWQDGGPCAQPIFAASGASGGSLGLGVYAANHLVSEPGTERVRDLLDEDFLSPTVGWFLFADLIRPFALWDYDGNATVDRARVLEVAWEEAWDERPVRDDVEPNCPSPQLLEQQHRDAVSLSSGLRETWCLGAPLLLLNGAEVNSACRFNTSVLDNNTRVLQDGRATEVPPTPVNCLRPPSGVSATTFANGPLGATIDLMDYLCAGDDIPLSTAALLSARFPFVSPSGRVADRSDRCANELGRSRFDPAFVVDGGYIDNSGASSLVELWAEVSSIVDQHNADDDNVCIVPVFLQLDNGYDFDRITPPNRPSEILVPLSTAMNARSSREAEAKQVAANIFASPTFSGNQRAIADGEPIGRWIRIAPEAHPGVQAPLGWVLSSAASRDLDAELDKETTKGFRELDELLSPDLRCTTADASYQQR